MSSSIEPDITASLLSEIARLRFRITTRDPEGHELGVMVEKPAHKPLLVDSSGGARQQWTLGVPPPGAAGHLISRDTYEMLRAGALVADGTLELKGKSYRLQGRVYGPLHVAELVPA